MSSILLSVLIPLFNEEEFIERVLQRVLEAPYPTGVHCEIIVVDDGSTDRSLQTVQSYIAQNGAPVKLISHTRNLGKGAAIRTALQHAQGEFSLVQDADLEYDPQEYPNLLRPLLSGQADIVFGSRFMTSRERRVLYFWHSLANQFLTLLCNIAADLNLTDIETCYKAFRTSFVKSIPLHSNRFGFEPELTVKAARRHARIFETPISYYGRTYDEGKKVGLKDAFEAVWVLLQARFTSHLYTDPGLEILDTLALAPNFNRWMADTILPFLGQRILEIGAGIGNLSRPLALHKPYYAATDIGSEYLNTLQTRFQHRPHFEVRRCDLQSAEDLSYFAGRVDTVVCLNVLEHIENADAAARNLYSVLPEGGHAIVLVPQGQELFGTLDLVLGHHLRYSKEQLRTRLGAAGFQVEHLLEFNRISRPGWYLIGKILKRQTLSRSALRSFNALVWLWRKIDHKLPWPAVSLIAIATKPSDKST